MMADETSTEAIYEDLKEVSEGKIGTSTEAIYENTQKPSEDKGKAAAASGLQQLLVMLGILCFLLVVTICIIIWISVEKLKHESNIRDLQNQTEHLRGERNNLDRTLNVILTSDSVPLHKFCPNNSSQLCLQSWLDFQKSCYRLNDEDHPNKTQSGPSCQNQSAELIVVNDLQEVKYISNFMEYLRFYENWSGLYALDHSWFWIDGSKNSSGFWIKVELVPSGPFSVAMSWWNQTNRWLLTV